MAINFPNSPSVNDIHSEGGVRWKWNGSSWTRASGAAVTDTLTTVNDNSTTTLYPVMTSGTGAQTPKVATTATKNISFDASDGNLTVGGNVSIGGTLTYEDVKNVDSVGIVTARDGVQITGDNKYLKIGAGNDISIVHTGSESFISNLTGHLTRRSDVHKWENYAGSSEYVRIDSSGRLLVGTTSNSISGSQIAEFDGMTYFTNNSSSTGTVYIRNQYSNTGLAQHIIFTDGSGNRAGFGLNNSDQLEIHGHQGILFKSGGTVGGGSEKFRITSTGQLLLGINNAVSSDVNFQLHSATSGTGPIFNMTNDSGDCRIFFGQDSSGSSANAQGQIRYNVGSNYLSAYTSGSERFRIDSSGHVMIGTTTEGYSGGDNLTISTSGDTGMTIRSGTTSQGTIAFSDATSGAAEYRGYVQYLHNGDALLFGTSSTERLRIDSSGNVMIGRTSASKTFSLRETSTSTGVHIVQTIGGANHVSAYAVGLGFDPEGYAARTKIAIVAEGTGAGYSRGKLHFLLDSTNDSGEATISESRMTIHDSGDVGINVVSNGRSPLHIHQPASASTYLHMTNASTGSTNNDGFSIYVATDGQTFYRARESAGTHRFYTNGSERLRITSDGDFGTNGVTPTAQAGKVFHLHAGSTQQRFHMTNNTTGSSATDGFEIIVEESANVRIRNFEAGALMFDTGGSNNECMRINSSGKLLVGRTSDITITGDGSSHVFEQNTDNGYALATHSDETNKRGIGIYYTSSSGASDAIRFAIQSTAKFIVLASGNCQNANNSYGSISDASLKENIVDAGSQWNDIKDIKIRNFNFKESSGQETHKQIGVVAQELETVCPKLVSTGQDGLKNVSSSVLYMKAVKALQEAMTRIESLEAEVAALKSA